MGTKWEKRSEPMSGWRREQGCWPGGREWDAQAGTGPRRGRRTHTLDGNQGWLSTAATGSVLFLLWAKLNPFPNQNKRKQWAQLVFFDYIPMVLGEEINTKDVWMVKASWHPNVY